MQDSPDDEPAPAGCRSATGVADERGATRFNDALGDLLVRIVTSSGAQNAHLWTSGIDCGRYHTLHC